MPELVPAKGQRERQTDDRRERERERARGEPENIAEQDVKVFKRGTGKESRGDHAIKTGAELGGFPYPTEAEHMSV